MVVKKPKARFLRNVLALLPILFTAVLTAGYITLFWSGQKTGDHQSASTVGLVDKSPANVKKLTVDREKLHEIATESVTTDFIN